MLLKMLQDFWKDPNNTSFTVVLQKSATAAWWPLTYHFQEIVYIPAGTPNFFSRPRSGTYLPENLQDAGDEGGADRVFIQGAPFDTIVLFKDASTRPRIDPHQYLHACLGHYSSDYNHLPSLLPGTSVCYFQTQTFYEDWKTLRTLGAHAPQ
eukprot:gene7289-biopygen7371